MKPPKNNGYAPPRQLGVELLRLLAMVAIVSGHFCTQNNVSGEYLITLLSSGANIAVNVFLLIGTWFMVDKPFNPLRPIKLLSTLLFYGWGLTAFVAIFFQTPCLQHILQGLFPFWGCALWFATAYIILLVASPYLHQIEQFSRNQAIFLGIILPGVITCISSTPWAAVSGSITAGIFWFFCVYLFMYTIKHHTRIFQIVPPLPCLLASLGLYAVLVFGLVAFHNNEKIYAILSLWRSGIHTLPNFLIALGIFIGFLRFKGECPKIIQYFSSSTFAIYVIHQMPVFVEPQWSLVNNALPFAMDSEIHRFYNIICVILALFILYPLIERFRVKHVEPKMISCQLSQKLCNFLNKYNISA